MTCLEKLRELNPLFDDKTAKDVIQSYCPFEWGIPYPAVNKCCHSKCTECWNQEIPEKEDRYL